MFQKYVSWKPNMSLKYTKIVRILLCFRPICAMPFVSLWSLKNWAELADMPILYLRGQGHVICSVSYANPLLISCSTCNDSLGAFRLKIQQTKLTNGLHYLLYSNCPVWPCFLLDEGIILKWFSKWCGICICITFMWLKEGFTFGHCEQCNKSLVCAKDFLIIWATTNCSVQCKLIYGLKTFPT
jgi:hypothetical protein